MDMPQHQRPGKRLPGVQVKRAHLKIDMTPMVDLGFLLIAFFVVTTRLSEPRASQIIVPAEGNSMPLANSRAITIIPSFDRIIYYEGEWKLAKNEGRIIELKSVLELRRKIQAKQLELDKLVNDEEGRNGLMLVIKPTGSSNYKTFVDVLDEVIINDVRKYAIDKLSADEKSWMTGEQH